MKRGRVHIGSVEHNTPNLRAMCSSPTLNANEKKAVCRLTSGILMKDFWPSRPISPLSA